MAKPQNEKNILSLAGEFLVAGKLNLMGYYASITLKNFQGIDVFVYNPKTFKEIRIQVKTRASGNRNVSLPEKINSDFFVFVMQKENKIDVDYYIVPSTDVAQMQKKEYENYIANHPNVAKYQPVWIPVNTFQEFKNKWSLIKEKIES